MLVSNLIRWLVPLFTIIMACYASENDIKQTETGDQVYKRSADRPRGRRNRNGRRRNNNQSHWLSFTPPAPNPDEVDCHIPLEMTRIVDGRCVRLGGRDERAVCQSGIHLGYFNNECESILSRREAREAPNPPEGDQQSGHTAN